MMIGGRGLERSVSNIDDDDDESYEKEMMLT